MYCVYCLIAWIVKIFEEVDDQSSVPMMMMMMIAECDGDYRDDSGVGGGSDNDNDDVYDEVNGPSSVAGKHKVTRHCWRGLVMRPKLDAL